MADWEMWVRVVAACGGVCINQVLASYRVFAAQDTARVKLTGDNLREYLRLADLWTQVIPDFERSAFLRLIASIAAYQVAEFTARGLPEAASANAQVLRDVQSRLASLEISQNPDVSQS